jgi:RES domain-containing protein
MVYTSSTAALAAMEVLAHLSAGTRIAFELIQFEFEDHLVKGVSLNALPSGWNQNSPPSSMTQRLGDHWVRAGSSAVFRVPSVHVPLGDSYLFNPLHPDFGRIDVVSQTSFSFDPRLIASLQTK